MNNYFRITAYSPEKDFCCIIDAYGIFERKWQFSSELVKRGLKIIEVSDDTLFLDVNIEKLTDIRPDKYVLRAYADGKPEYIKHTINGVTYTAVKVGEKIYIPSCN